MRVGYLLCELSIYLFGFVTGSTIEKQEQNGVISIMVVL